MIRWLLEVSVVLSLGNLRHHKSCLMLQVADLNKAEFSQEPWLGLPIAGG